MNEAGKVGFFAILDGGGTGLFTGNGASITTIALKGDPLFSGFAGIVSLNNAGMLAFHGVLDSSEESRSAPRARFEKRERGCTAFV